MANCQQAADCQPCADCDPPAQPVLPRCQDIVLADGAFTNATVVVEEGCITAVSQGSPLQYTPDPCCAPIGGGGGGGGTQGPPGEDGEAATIAIGMVTTTAPGTNATVSNSGTQTHAIFDFTIPRGEAGDSGDTGTGLTGDFAGFEVDNGLVQALPTDWPPVMQIVGQGSPDMQVLVVANKDPSNGQVTLTVDINGYDQQLRIDMQALIDDLQDQIDTQQGQIDTLTARVDALCNGDPCP